MYISNLINKELKNIIDSNIFGEGFSFRTGQDTAIHEIVQHYINDKTGIVLLDGPTGSGKSIVAISTAIVLKNLFSKDRTTGYILTSDKMLQDQYYEDFKKFGLDWGNVKGRGNYMCSVADKPFSIGHCVNTQTSEKDAKKWDCYEYCGYLQARRKAVYSDVTLMNYYYWLTQMNVAQSNLFGKRDFTFFDECHKLGNIVQTHYEIVLKDVELTNTDNVIAFCEKIKLKNRPKDSNNLKMLFSDIHAASYKTDIKELLGELSEALTPYSSCKLSLNKEIKEKFGVDEQTVIPKEYVYNLKRLTTLSNIKFQIDEYIANANMIGDDNTIVKINNNFDKSISLKTTDERFLIAKSVLAKSNFKVFMSATIGNHEQFSEFMGLGKVKSVYIPSNFDFTKSPIWLNYDHKINNGNKLHHFNVLEPHMVKLFDHHINHRGVVHTASHQNTKLMEEKFKGDRFIFYTKASERDAAIEEYKSIDNAILFGSSIYEGLDLPDDLCRFQVLLKAPFANIGDPLVNAKKDIDPPWYRWDTLNKIAQSIGRGLRHKNDWVITYILDKQISDMLRYSGISNITSRMKPPK